MTPDEIQALRPELHRYCARLMGSIVDGEDIVQEALTRALAIPAGGGDMSRPLLFKIAHNAAIDALRRHERRFADGDDALDAVAADDEAVDPAIVHVALAVFQRLPVAQRSAVILKDVLGCTLEEIVESTGLTLLAVKAALVRGRATLRAHADDRSAASVAAPPDPAERARLHAYAARFNARDWDGLRTLLADETRLELVARAERRGKAVGEYFARYAALPDLRAVPGLLDGRPALAVYSPPEAPSPGSFVLLAWDGDRITLIRDFRYAEYAMECAATSFVPD
ncbi:MAG TPA: sigma factor [Kofleriaceae bacterium]|nr:sigma factor [Kofleriaceae bacterium]